ncbi:MAG TPA: hypothetical protein DCZ94_01665 [Lentisphaeria bacterium]|nr:MAG: hypothetical protein A2X48_21545 [Lentisphaerae bacterium GWF2_49_21]HBC85639.1 hypothetical protein [Lentisphaeria bacterium]
MKRHVFTLAALFLFGAVTLQAVEVLVEKKEGQARGEYVSSDPNGDIALKQDNKFTIKIKAADYKYARLAKTPDEILAADKKFDAQKYAEAMADYKNLYNAYKFVGFDVYCIYKESACLEKLGKKADALARLKIMDTYQCLDPKKLPDFFDCKKLQATLLIDTGKFDEAFKVLTDLGNSNDDNLAAFSFIARGDILSKQGKKKEAVLKYMVPALIFPQQNTERPKALLLVANTLKEMNDNRSTKFAEILKKEYADSPQVKELK